MSLTSSLRNPRVRSATAGDVRSVDQVIGKAVRQEELHLIEGYEGNGLVVAGRHDAS